MTKTWKELFDEYWRNRPGAPTGHNPVKVFEAGFLAGVNYSEIPNDSIQWGVMHFDSEGKAEDVWAAEDEHEARYEATGFGGKMMTRTVGPWEVVE